MSSQTGSTCFNSPAIYDDTASHLSLVRGKQLSGTALHYRVNGRVNFPTMRQCPVLLELALFAPCEKSLAPDLWAIVSTEITRPIGTRGQPLQTESPGEETGLDMCGAQEILLDSLTEMKIVPRMSLSP